MTTAIEKIKSVTGSKSGFDPAHDRWGVIFVNMGGPETTDQIKPYLRSIFSDRSIIKLPLSFLLQKPFARLISTLRTPRVTARYKLIGGGSPLLRYDRMLAKGVCETLTAEFPNLRAYVGMRYIEPFIDTQLQQAINEGCKHLVVIPMYPHYCLATTGTALSVIANFLSAQHGAISIDIVEHWHDCGGYIALLRTRIEQALTQVDPASKTQLLFSAHSIPESIRLGGDPYVDQITHTCKLACHDHDYLLSFQSATGPVKWVGPDTLATIDKLAGEGVKQLVIVPISFVSDNIETLYDIDIVMQERCRHLGMLPLIRTAMFNGEPDFVEFMAGLVREKARAS
jgi:protoporphyrin/coproporphyrin ferrochelatase